jgi:biotin carboxyl carrier protein
MKQYKINVNGTFYEVYIEEVDASEIKAAAPAAPAVEEKPAATAPAGGETVNAPMPGNILSVNIKVGDVVKVAVLEVDEKRKRIGLTMKNIPKEEM